MKTNSNKAFTLIELLVVIAIIGILAGIVLVSLAGARNTAKDGRVKADMNQIRSEAQIIELETDSYATVCTNADIVTLTDDIEANAATDTITCYDTTDAYCVSIELNSGEFYCVDSGLNSSASTTDNCDGDNDLCSD